jgi:hypothetical protein
MVQNVKAGKYGGSEVRNIGKRHPELVSGSIFPMQPLYPEARWMLKQVQHDGAYVANFGFR